MSDPIDAREARKRKILARGADRLQKIANVQGFSIPELSEPSQAGDNLASIDPPLVSADSFEPAQTPFIPKPLSIPTANELKQPLPVQQTSNSSLFTMLHLIISIGMGLIGIWVLNECEGGLSGFASSNHHCDGKFK